MLTHLLPIEVADDNDIIIEVTAGVGGQEAMLFTKEVLTMYMNYANHRGWSFELLDSNGAEHGN